MTQHILGMGWRPCTWCGRPTWPGLMCSACLYLHKRHHLRALDNHDQTCENGETMITEALWNLIKHHASVQQSMRDEGYRRPCVYNLTIDAQSAKNAVLMAADLHGRLRTPSIGVYDARVVVDGVVETTTGHSYSTRVTFTW